MVSGGLHLPPDFSRRLGPVVKGCSKEGTEKYVPKGTGKNKKKIDNGGGGGDDEVLKKTNTRKNNAQVRNYSSINENRQVEERERERDE